MDRLEYATVNHQKYLDWLGAVSESPWTVCDRLEFAIISAHTPMAKAILAWQATRGVDGVVNLAELLYAIGVVAPYNKAGYIASLRREQPFPSWPYRDYRRDIKIPGLGLCKLSFGCCLIDPFNSDVVCLDTHILQVYLGRRPTKSEVGVIYRNPRRYQEIEDVLTGEANQSGLPPFGYQWAIWDWKRARVDMLPPLDHSFLWRGGPRQYQLPLFSSLA